MIVSSWSLFLLLGDLNVVVRVTNGFHHLPTFSFLARVDNNVRSTRSIFTPSIFDALTTTLLPLRATPLTWPIEDAVNSETTTWTAKCARNSRADGVCCKELKVEEGTLIDQDIVGDVIIGLLDGLTVPFAPTAGLSSLSTSCVVVLARGVAELIAGAISMAIGGFLASQAERDHLRYLKNQTAARVVRSCSGEMEREVEEVLGPIGVDESTCRAVAKSLRDSGGEEEASPESRTSDVETGSSLRWSKDLGLTAFLLKFGQGMEEVPTRRLYISAFTIGMGYLIGGLIPLFPYFFIPHAQTALVYSCIVTGVVLLIFGAIKAPGDGR
ncbi:hypothetical protein K435DRAFT_840370 [Dendrothele bispora CBS 962.96]|uniref:DUF125-domain-containing protein n=1 Tax=Dendrothele bispora (strain CBS 962.96) TaxID=1314807 RepID=A0A4S8LUC2_DENBC|nr:hypothetical protein K435DRAFT_840370 [Dendrothele bispora CBS 962.96]